MNFGDRKTKRKNEIFWNYSRFLYRNKTKLRKECWRTSCTHRRCRCALRYVTSTLSWRTENWRAWCFIRQKDFGFQNRWKHLIY